MQNLQLRLASWMPPGAARQGMQSMQCPHWLMGPAIGCRRFEGGRFFVAHHMNTDDMDI